MENTQMKTISYEMWIELLNYIFTLTIILISTINSEIFFIYKIGYLLSLIYSIVVHTIIGKRYQSEYYTKYVKNAEFKFIFAVFIVGIFWPSIVICAFINLNKLIIDFIRSLN